MGDITNTVLQSGLVTPELASELTRWGMLTGPVPEDASAIPAKDVPAALEQVMQSEEYVSVKETDLEALHQYLSTQKIAQLHFELLGGETEDVEISYGKTLSGEYIIAWTDEDISDALANGLTYLLVDGVKVSITATRELYFGDRKVFVVCKVVPEK